MGEGFLGAGGGEAAEAFFFNLSSAFVPALFFQLYTECLFPRFVVCDDDFISY